MVSLLESARNLFTPRTGILTFTDQTHGQQIIFIDAPVRIGRDKVHYGYTDRTMPIDVTGVTNQLIITGPSVSRTHALVWQLMDAQTGNPTGHYFIQDLNSKNGTAIKKPSGNIIPVTSAGPTLLQEGDVILIPAKTGLSGQTITFGFRKRTTQRRALIVGTDPDNKLVAIPKQSEEVRKTLISLGFAPKDIFMLNDPIATREAVLNVLDYIASKSDEQSLFVFHYLGHGHRHGELFVKEPGARLTAAKIVSAFSLIKGNKLAIIDCCHAKNFEALGAIPNTAFLGASQKDEPAWYRSAQGGVFTQAIIRTLRNSLSKNNNYVRIDRIEEVEAWKTQHSLPEQGFTMVGQVCFTAEMQPIRDIRPQHLKSA